MSKILDNLKVRCIEEGTSLTKVCKSTGVNRGTLTRWEKTLPSPLAKVEKINAELDRLKRIRMHKVRECTNCHALISSMVTNCPECGWNC